MDGAAASRADPHPWRAAVLLAFLTVAAGLLYSTVVVPSLQHMRVWWINDEVWAPFRGAHYILDGAYPFLYEADRRWIAGPLLPVVLIPVAAMEDVFGWHWNEAHPGVWLVYATMGLSVTAPLVAWFQALARAAGALSRRGALSARTLLAGEIGVVVLVAVPIGIVFGHFEDLFSLAFLLLALRELLRARYVRSGIWLGVALAFKQWSILALPAALALVPRQDRVRWLVGSIGIPAVLLGIPLAADWEHASAALFHGRAFTAVGHAAPWLIHPGDIVSGGPYRALVVAVACLAAIPVSRRRNPETLFAALALVFLVRLFLEPAVFGYYPSPALLFLLLHSIVANRTSWRTIALGTGVLVLFPFHPPPALWWGAEVALAVALAAPAARELRGSRTPAEVTS